MGVTADLKQAPGSMQEQSSLKEPIMSNLVLFVITFYYPPPGGGAK